MRDGPGTRMEYVRIFAYKNVFRCLRIYCKVLCGLVADELHFSGRSKSSNAALAISPISQLGLRI